MTKPKQPTQPVKDAPKKIQTRRDRSQVKTSTAGLTLVDSDKPNTYTWSSETIATYNSTLDYEMAIKKIELRRLAEHKFTQLHLVIAVLGTIVVYTAVLAGYLALR